MNLIVLISELITIFLSIYAFTMIWKFYKKFKVKLITGLFASFIGIWIIKSISRLFTDSDIIDIPDIVIWSIVGMIQIILFVALFKYLINKIEVYL